MTIQLTRRGVLFTAILIAVVIGLFTARQTVPIEAQAQASAGLVPVYEYKLDRPIRGDVSEVVEQLNALGAAGWEIQGASAVDEHGLQNSDVLVYTAFEPEIRRRAVLLLRRVTGYVKER